MNQSDGTLYFAEGPSTGQAQPQRTFEFSVEERRRIGKQLAEEVPLSLIEERPNGGSQKVCYITHATACKQANRIFGADRWTSKIESSKILYKKQVNGSYEIAVMAIMSIILPNNTMHQDVGFGEAKRKREADAYEHAVKSAFTDARKRALRQFGPALGLNLNERDHVRERKAEDRREKDAKRLKVSGQHKGAIASMNLPNDKNRTESKIYGCQVNTAEHRPTENSNPNIQQTTHTARQQVPQSAPHYTQTARQPPPNRAPPESTAHSSNQTSSTNSNMHVPVSNNVPVPNGRKQAAPNAPPPREHNRDRSKHIKTTHGPVGVAAKSNNPAPSQVYQSSARSKAPNVSGGCNRTVDTQASMIPDSMKTPSPPEVAGRTSSVAAVNISAPPCFDQDACSQTDADNDELLTMMQRY
mmetsp:Transcript_15487/g.25343  ORF Transcript_15487/g.25343 Transcript_15487/m.25343 type:complete len:414 (+) Transcript_15487:646-1887(+)|eukprot:CAMPEP_0203776496 /NCGR_PEP_ID=MMETSP0099_2-20121227/6786_1 /ASSEMBLY_ACC=CAM_ASM_000209 /TAXON_ID=96639 /ORGANISM=" , Strain NY0313808BC1" /LENGTH=413 /DNA_ID=CAMNT_0050675525 /DNA_START=297 /DNA_END=1538 /DNA_ORIENTATION=+